MRCMQCKINVLDMHFSMSKINSIFLWKVRDTARKQNVHNTATDCTT